LKFTKKGGQVKIYSKYISGIEDLTFGEEPLFIDVVKQARNGVLEIQVEDSGIGI